MTRKDYQIIAEGLRISAPQLDTPEDRTKRHQWHVTCHVLAEILALDNPRFDREKFLAACGL